jgi:hypothetical protein
MQTSLDALHELELDRYVYNGRDLVAEVVELIVGNGGRVAQGHRRYMVRFDKPLAHAVTEELPAAAAQLVQGDETGFLRRVDASALRAALGVDLEQFEEFHAYALLTAHEVLVVYCLSEPTVEKKDS